MYMDIRKRRSELIATTKTSAEVDGKAVGRFYNTVTGLNEIFTYMWNPNQRSVDLVDYWSNAEELFPPFRDASGRIIRY